MNKGSWIQHKTNGWIGRIIDVTNAWKPVEGGLIYYKIRFFNVPKKYNKAWWSEHVIIPHQLEKSPDYLTDWLLSPNQKLRKALETKLEKNRAANLKPQPRLDRQ